MDCVYDLQNKMGPISRKEWEADKDGVKKKEGKILGPGT